MGCLFLDVVMPERLMSVHMQIMEERSCLGWVGKAMDALNGAISLLRGTP